jgi:hypothetical protein
MHGHMNVKCVIQSVLKTFDVFLLITEANITKSWFNLRIIFFTSGCTVNFSGLKSVQVTSCVLFFCCYILPWKPEFDPRTVLVELTGGQSSSGTGLFLKRLWVSLSVSFHQDSILIRSPVRLLRTPCVVWQRDWITHFKKVRRAGFWIWFSVFLE